VKALNGVGMDHHRSLWDGVLRGQVCQQGRRLEAHSHCAGNVLLTLSLAALEWVCGAPLRQELVYPLTVCMEAFIVPSR
jgi:hypothetical protein